MSTRNLSEANEELGLSLLRQARPLRGLSPEQVLRIAKRLAAPPARPGLALTRSVLVGIALALLFSGSALAWVTGAFPPLFANAPFDSGAERGARAHKSDVASGPTNPMHPAPLVDEGRVPSRDAQRLAFANEQSSPRVGDQDAALPPAVDDPLHRKQAHSKERAEASPSTPEKPAGEAAPERAPRPEEPESAIVAEGRSLAAARAAWRRRETQSALGLLDSHERRFAGGQMVLEARLLRVEILLAQGRRSDALAILEPIRLEGAPRSRELRTLRGELRVAAGRCQAARDDLTPVARGADALARRAQKALERCP